MKRRKCYGITNLAEQVGLSFLLDSLNALNNYNSEFSNFCQVQFNNATEGVCLSDDPIYNTIIVNSYTDGQTTIEIAGTPSTSKIPSFYAEVVSGKVMEQSIEYTCS